MGMTIAEKILARKGGHPVVEPGDLVTVGADAVVLTDISFIYNRRVEVLGPADILLDWVHARNPAPFEPVYADPDAHYKAVRKVNLSARLVCERNA